MRHVLFLDELQPGDIVLSRSPTPVSAAIRVATGGLWSHAALVLDPLVWFEALGTGVGSTVLKPEFGVHDGKLRAALDCGYVRYAVYRWHDDPAREAAFGVRSATSEPFRDWVVTSDLYSYPGLEGFMDLIPLGLGMRLTTVARRIDHDRVKGVPGSFCSELVSRAYERVGLPLFPMRKPTAISPRRLSFARGLRRIASSGRIRQLEPVPPHLQQYVRSFGPLVDQYLVNASIRRGMFEALKLSHSVNQMQAAAMADLRFQAARLPQRGGGIAQKDVAREDIPSWLVQQYAESVRAAEQGAILGQVFEHFWSGWNAASKCIETHACHVNADQARQTACMDYGCTEVTHAQIVSRKDLNDLWVGRKPWRPGSNTNPEQVYPPAGPPAPSQPDPNIQPPFDTRSENSPL